MGCNSFFGSGGSTVKVLHIYRLDRLPGYLKISVWILAIFNNFIEEKDI